MAVDRGTQRTVLRAKARGHRRQALTRPRLPRRAVRVPGPRTAGRAAPSPPAPQRSVVRPARRRRVLRVAVPAVAGVLVLVRALLVAARLPATPVETQLIDAVLRSGGPAAPPIGLDALAARVQLSAYAQLTGAFDRHATALAGARELGLLACAVLVAALVALAHGLGVRPLVTVAVLGALAAVPAAVGVLVTVGPGLLGATWLTLGAALLAQRRPGLRAVGLPAVVAGVVSAPVLAVTVLVGGAAVLVALRRRCNALVAGVAIAATVLPLALLPAPGGAVVVPLLVVVAVLVGFVLADEIVDRAVRSRARRTAPGRSS